MWRLSFDVNEFTIECTGQRNFLTVSFAIGQNTANKSGRNGHYAKAHSKSLSLFYRRNGMITEVWLILSETDND